MSKSHKERTGGRQTAGESPLIPERYQHLVAIALLFLSLIVFFNQLIFSGKMFTEADILASRSFDTFLTDAKQEGVFPLWNPYIFCGMPSYGSLTVGGDRFFDISAQVLTRTSTVFSYIILNPAEGWVLFFYFVFACGIYLFTYQKVKSKFPAFIAAFAAMFSMYIIIWVMTGHNTKIAVIAFFPYIFYAVERLREKFSWFLALLLVLLLHFSYMPSHVQMIFYMYLTLYVYLCFLLIRESFVRKEYVLTLVTSVVALYPLLVGLVPANTINRVIFAFVGMILIAYIAWRAVKVKEYRRPIWIGSILVATSMLAFAMDADKYLSVLEYNPYSMRGSNAIVSTNQPGDTKTVQGGLDYDYATSWSFAPGEVLTWVIPSWYGFGQVNYKGFFTGNQEGSVNFYWGPQPFTHAPQYMGLIVLILAVVGFVRNRKDPFVQFLALMIVISLLISFGREFPLLYDLMYRYFPMFNKFRIPSMILVMIQIFVPILAAYGIASFLREHDQIQGVELQKRKRSILVWFGAVAGILLLVALTFESLLPRQAIQNLFSVFANYSLPRDRVVEQVFRQIPPQASREIISQLSSMVTSDIYVAVGFLLVTCASLYTFIQRKMKLTTFAAILTLVIATDLWRVAAKPMEPHDKSVQKQAFAAPEYIKYVQKDTTLFRVLEFKDGRPPYNNMLAFWRIQSAYGYQGAKMRAYQDMDDVIGMGNPLLWGLMNVKYIITNTPDSSAALGLVYNGRDMKVYSNRYMLPRAFFVNRYEVTDGLTVLNKIKDMSFNPRDVAFFMEDPKISVEPPHPSAGAEIVRYGIQDLEIKTTTSGNNLLFLSETYYPVGWKAFIDGKETPIYRANYLFRAVVVPPGVHKLEMKFEPKGFYFGKNLSLAANIVILGGLGFFGFDYWRKKRTPKQADEQLRA